MSESLRNTNPARDSEAPVAMAAPRPAKRLRRGPEPLPDIDPPPRTVPDNASVSRATSSIPTLPIPINEPQPVPSDDDAGSDSGADPAGPEATEATSSNPTPTRAAPRNDFIPRIGHAIRGWATVDDNELIAYKKDIKSRHSWKVIGSKLHRDPDSCKARWLWLKSSRPDLATPGADTED